MKTSSNQTVGPYFTHLATLPQKLGQVKKDTMESDHCNYLPLGGSWEHCGEGGNGDCFLFILRISVLFEFFDHEHTCLNNKTK